MIFLFFLLNFLDGVKWCIYNCPSLWETQYDAQQRNKLERIMHSYLILDVVQYGLTLWTIYICMHDLNVTPWYADNLCAISDMRYIVIKIRQGWNKQKELYKIKCSDQRYQSINCLSSRLEDKVKTLFK